MWSTDAHTKYPQSIAPRNERSGDFAEITWPREQYWLLLRLKVLYRRVVQIYPSTCLVLVPLNGLCNLIIQISIVFANKFPGVSQRMSWNAIGLFWTLLTWNMSLGRAACTAFHWHFVSMIDGVCSQRSDIYVLDWIVCWTLKIFKGCHWMIIMNHSYREQTWSTST